MSNVYAPNLRGATVANLVVNLSQVAGTYNAGTVSVGDIVIKSITPFVSTAATGLTSASISTDNTTADVVLASTLLATLTGGKNLTAVVLPIYLPSGKHIQYTIVGTGTGGQINLAVEYYPLAAGAIIS